MGESLRLIAARDLIDPELIRTKATAECYTAISLSCFSGKKYAIYKNKNKVLRTWLIATLRCRLWARMFGDNIMVVAVEVVARFGF